MKVLQFVADGAPGGGTNHVLQLLHGCADMDLVLLTQQDSYLESVARKLPITVVTGDFQRSRIDRCAVRLVSETLEEHRPNLVHCHGGRAAFFASWTRNSAPRIYTVHGFHFARKKLAARIAGWLGELWAIRHMDQIVFVCEYDERLAHSSKLMPRGKKGRVIYNGVPAPDVKATGEKLGVGFIGRMVYQKNPLLFLDAIECLPNVTAVMAGGGDLEEQVRTEVERRGLGERVRMLGGLGHTEALSVLADLDVLLMTPRWEGLPLLPLEAMFLGVPVVSTAVGGIPEIITHGENGLLGGTGAALAEQVQEILDDTELRDQIVANASTRVGEQFGQDDMIRSVRQTYDSVITRQPRRRGAVASPILGRRQTHH